MQFVAKSILVVLPLSFSAAAALDSNGKSVLGTKRGKVYHTHPEDCGSARRIGEANRLWFKSIEEAEKVGRRLCKLCQTLDRKAKEAEDSAKKERTQSGPSAPKEKAGGARSDQSPTSHPAEMPAPAVLPVLARVTAVLAGGTLVLDNGDKATVLGVVCPESGQPMAKTTAKWIREQTDGLVVQLVHDSFPCGVQQRDGLGRGLVYVTLGPQPQGRDLGAELLRKGYGWLDRGAQFQRRPAYVRHETQAWRNERGVWKRQAGAAGQEEVLTGRHAWAYHRQGCPHLHHLVGLIRMTLNEAKERRLVPCSRYRVEIAAP